MQMDGSLAGPRFRKLSETGNSKFMFCEIKRTSKNFRNLNMGKWKCFLKPQSRLSETGTSEVFEPQSKWWSEGALSRQYPSEELLLFGASPVAKLSSTLLIEKLEIGISWHVSRGHLFRVLEKNSRIVSLPRNVIDRSIVDLKTRILSTCSFKTLYLCSRWSTIWTVFFSG